MILHGGKDIENRTWTTRYRGPVLIHASRTFHAEEIERDLNEAAAIVRRTRRKPACVPTLAMLRKMRGCIVGRARIVDCVARSRSPWFSGPYGFVLAEPVPLKPVPLKGALGLFNCPPEIAARLRRA